MQNLRATSLLSLFVTVVAACGGATPGQNGELGGRDDAEGASGALVGQAATASVEVRTSVTVACMVRKDGVLVAPSFEITAMVSPSSTPMQVEGHEITVTPQSPGTVSVRCHSVDLAVVAEDAVLIEARPGLPARFSASLANDECVPQRTRLALTARVEDRYGFELTDVTFDSQVTPSEGVAFDDVGLPVFTADGTYQVRVVPQGPTADGVVLAPFVETLHVDSTPPVLVFESPERGAMLLGSGATEETITVRGYVTDLDSGIEYASLNAEALTLDSQGRFSRTITGRFGLNTLVGEVVDACGNHGGVAHSFLLSGAYGPTSGAVPVLRGSDVVARIDGSLVNDYDRSDVDDLRTILERAAQSFDINAMAQPGTVFASDPLRNDCSSCGSGPFWADAGFSVARHPSLSKVVEFGGIGLTALELVDGGMRLGIELGALNYPLRLNASARECSGGCESSQSLTVDADVGFDRLIVQTTAAIQVTNGAMSVSLPSLNFDIVGLYIDLDCGSLDDVCDKVTDAVVDATVARLEDAVEELILEKVAAAAYGLGEGLGLQQEIELPAPMSGTLSVAARLTELSMCGSSAGIAAPGRCANDTTSLLAGIAVHVAPSARGANIPANARGPIRRNNSVMNVGTKAVGLGVRDDLIDNVLWALWYGGAMTFDDLGALVDLPEGIAASVEVGLPPVLMGSSNPNEARLGIGEIRIRARATPAALGLEAALGSDEIVVALRASMVVGATVEVDGNGKLRLGLSPDPEFALEVDEFPHANGQALGVFLTQLVSNLLPVYLASTVAEVELPKLTVDGLPNVAPTVWRAEAPVVSHGSGYLSAGGNLAVSSL